MAGAILAIKSAFEIALRFLGPIFVLLGFSLISFAVYVHFTFVLSWYSGEPVLTLSIYTLFHLSVDIWLCIGIAWNYFKCAATLALKFDVELSPEELAAIQSTSAGQSSRKNTRYCKYCTSILAASGLPQLQNAPYLTSHHSVLAFTGQKGKIDRIHHCHVCNTYVSQLLFRSSAILK